MVKYKKVVKAGKISRNWKAIKNLKDNLDGNTKEARAKRLLFYEKTGLAPFKESNYKKFLETGRGKPLSVKLVRHAHTIIKEQNEKIINREYEAEIKDRVTWELNKIYQRQASKARKAKKKVDSFTTFLRKNQQLKKKTERLERRNLTLAKYRRSNKATLEKVTDFASVTEMYNSPD